MRHPDPAWHHPPGRLTLTEQEVHVWQAELDLAPGRVEELHCVLTADERERAARFHFDRDRDRFIVAHGVLRDILGRYLEVEPGVLRFRYSPYGKPALAGRFDGERIRFNLAHSDRLALYAVTRGREVGIDVEYVREDLADEQIAEQFFSPQEVGVLRSVPKDRRKEAFFNCWTRKEAYVKARGEGLSLPLNQFDVSLAPGDSAALVSTRGDAREASRWSLQEISPGPGYVAALAVEGHSWQLRCWQWPGPVQQNCNKNSFHTFYI
jgi:4'-phosphopantetheinyl transferase